MQLPRRQTHREHDPGQLILFSEEGVIPILDSVAICNTGCLEFRVGSGNVPTDGMSVRGSGERSEGIGNSCVCVLQHLYSSS